jgi:hypothetical protein
METVRLWRNVEQYPTTQLVAEALGMTPDSVYKRLRQAKKEKITWYSRMDHSEKAHRWFHPVRRTPNTEGGDPSLPR